MKKEIIIPNEKFKNIKNKNRLELVDPNFILSVGEVLTFGATKYSPNSWKKVNDPINIYYAAALRHIFKWKNGEILDSESNLHHLKHAAANLMFLLYFEENKK